ncbi:hypothetical protein K503DRAFT_483549 [Rhizopogon vinicolor AM-OR11-026]|uniref:Uncharacterized protein n=1 Tax=Rhizopogon vinicolor AM-OR11-026 TaxID=1314800 RepID=A0A1B7MMS4_9AGAM|nr:hypothetical protein K503DRAFT_483549 [Rhizopogon vinicolor AM-OR11-026]
MWSPTRFSLPFIFLSWASIVRSQCTLKVPQNPLTAQGLATPYELTGCNQLDFADQGVFVEAAIIDPATGQIQIYNPLVINAGMTAVGTNGSSSSAMTSTSSAKTSNGNTGTMTTSSSPTSSALGSQTNKSQNETTSTTSSAGIKVTPVARAAATQGAGFFVPPIVPTLPANAVVGLWFGSNAQTVTLTGDIATCVNGLGNSVFGQYAYCNAQAWFSATTAAVQSGMTNVSAPGTGSSGQACPTIRDFRIVDQDQSDNVVTTYLMIGGNTLAQNTPANSQANPDAEVLSNASDNALINDFIQPALGCSLYSNPCTTCPQGQTPALSTNELQASFFPPAGGTALVPLNDPMVLVNGQQSLQKVNLYRAGVNQPQADSTNASGTTYCQQFAQSGLFISLNQQLFSGTASPATDQATNLFTFLAMRFSMSFGPAPGLGCTQLLNVNNPVTLTTDGNGIVTAATINTQALQQIFGETTTTGTTNSTSTSHSTSQPSTSTTQSCTHSTSTSHSTSQPSTSASHSTTSTSQSAASVTPSGVRLVNTTLGSAATTSMTTTTSPHVVTSCSNSAVTVTVTATVCPSPSPQWDPYPSNHGTSSHHWPRGIPVMEHSRMQKKNRRLSNW